MRKILDRSDGDWRTVNDRQQSKREKRPIGVFLPHRFAQKKWRDKAYVISKPGSTTHQILGRTGIYFFKLRRMRKAKG